MDISRNIKFHAMNVEGNPFIATANAPSHWIGYAWRREEYQSWDRPFKLEIMVSTHKNRVGPRIIVDTGEAFAWFDKANMVENLAQSSPFGGIGGFVMGGLIGGGLFGPDPLMMAMSQQSVTVPETGRPERRFVSPSAYLDDLMREWDDGFIARNQIWLMGDYIVGESAQDATERELRNAKKENKEWAEAGIQGADVRVGNALDRTVMKHWRLIDGEGQNVHLFVGAKLKGFDMFCFPSGRAQDVLGRYSFGNAPRGNASFYEVLWMAEKRFYGVLVDGDWDVSEFGNLVTEFATSTAFSKELMSEMTKHYISKSKVETAKQKQRNAEFHQYNKELGERLRQRDIERQDRMRQHEDQMRADRERRRAWDRKMDSDRRVRDAWSEAIRGTERYRDPYGHMVEVQVTGPNQRAFYDHLSGRTVMSDVTDLDKPSDWEELPRW